MITYLVFSCECKNTPFDNLPKYLFDIERIEFLLKISSKFNLKNVIIQRLINTKFFILLEKIIQN